MKTKKLLSKLTQFFSADRRAQMEDINAIKIVLKELKKKESKLKEKRSEEKNQQKYDDIETKLRVIYAQRKKGVAMLKDLLEK